MSGAVAARVLVPLLLALHLGPHQMVTLGHLHLLLLLLLLLHLMLHLILDHLLLQCPSFVSHALEHRHPQGFLFRRPELLLERQLSGCSFDDLLLLGELTQLRQRLQILLVALLGGRDRLKEGVVLS
jgi:hypothetical protein